MKNFGTLQELLDYIPKCILCGKDMELRITGGVPSRQTSENYWKNNDVCLKMFLLEDKLHSKKCKDYSLSVSPITNLITSGKNLISDMVSRSYSRVTANKKCRTCFFQISTAYSRDKETPKLRNYFPALTMQTEELHYTMKKGKSVKLYKYYRSDSLTGENTNISVNFRSLKSIPLDFSKIHNMEHLNNKIKTLMVFQ